MRSRFLEEIDSSVIRTEAGESFNQKSDRFKLRDRDAFSYDQLDPNYYKESLSQQKKKISPPKRKSIQQPIEKVEVTGRRVVYDEGEGPIVPGVVVEHETFGQGKVLAMEGQGQNVKATVFFKSVGQKKLALRFAKLRLVG